MLSKTVGKGVLCAFLLALMTLATASAQTWWNPDYAMRIPVAITNNTGTATPTPCTAEVTITPVPTGIRSDWADVQVVYWNGTTNTPVHRQILTDTADSMRLVFRLQTPIPAGSTTNAYAVYYGNPSPLSPGTDPKSIYDKVLDFSADTVGAAPSEWIIPLQILPPTISVAEIGGVKHMVVANTSNHRRVMADPAKCPTFLNVEMYTRMMPYPSRVSGEIACIARTPTNPYALDTDGTTQIYGGGFGVSLDAFGDNYTLTKFADPNILMGGSLVLDTGSVYQTAGGVKENTILRITGTGVETALSSKSWKDGTAQPPWKVAGYTDENSGGTTDHYYEPGVVAFNSYQQGAAIEFYALRELRDLAAVTGGAQTGPESGPYLQGTVASTKLGPIANAQLTITDGVNTWAVTCDAAGKYKITLPDTAAGYTLTANYFAHQQAQVTGAHPSPTGITNLTLTYKGVIVKGVVRDRWYQGLLKNMKVVLTDTNGYFVQSTMTNSAGEYSFEMAGAGSWILSTVGFGRGARTTAAGADGATVVKDLIADIPANGDCETPNASNTWPEHWDIYDGYGAGPTYRGLSREQNHTPGGFWSMKIWQPQSDYSGTQTGIGWATNNLYLHPVIPGTSYTFSVWVYFTNTGDRLRVRMRDGHPGGSIDVYAGQVPPAKNENKGGLDPNGKVPVNQWYEVRTTWPYVVGGANNPVAFSYNLYSFTTQTGTIYYDDVTMTATPVSLYQVIGKVVDHNGKAIPNPYMGEMHYNNKLLSFPSQGDVSGVVRVLTTSTAPLTLGAWKGPDNRDGTALVPNGALVGMASATPIPYDANNNTPSATVTVNTKARNILSADTTTGLIHGDSIADRYLIDKRVDKYTGETPDSTNPADWVQITRPAIPADYANQDINWIWDNNVWTEGGHAWGSGGLRGILSADSNTDIPDRYRTSTLDIDLGSSQTIDQLEFGYFFYVDKHRIWISDTPFQWNVELPNASAVVDTTTDGVSVKGQGFQSGNLPYDADSNYGLDWYMIYRFNPPIQGRYLRVRQDGSPYGDGHQILMEMRAMSASAWTPTFTQADLELALKIAAGLEQAFDTDLPKLDVNQSGSVTVDDAAIIAKTIVAES